MANTPTPKEIKLHQKSNLLEIQFDDDTECKLSCEMLRVYSPSAEVQGHSPDQAVLQIGKEDVGIIEISPVGNYAIKIKFSDGHDTGLFSWDYLHHLAKNYDQLWLEYIGKLDAQGIQRKIIE
tara:strand:- start:124 stop:492 length:369 start_codon:yes stop_codon:yes gene_type:complete